MCYMSSHIMSFKTGCKGIIEVGDKLSLSNLKAVSANEQVAKLSFA